MPSNELAKRFLANIEVDEEYCYHWTGPQHSEKGYGVFHLRSDVEPVKAERFAAHLGDLDVGGEKISRFCDSPDCVNPRHLYVGSPFGDEKVPCEGAYVRRGEAHGRSKLSRFQVRRMREDRRTGSYTLSELSEKYGVSTSQVRAITTGKQWTHAGGPITEPYAVTDEEVAEIRGRYWWCGDLQAELAEEFGVGASYVSMLVRGKSRSDAPGPISSDRTPVPKENTQAVIRDAFFRGVSPWLLQRLFSLPGQLVKWIVLGEAERNAAPDPVS